MQEVFGLIDVEDDYEVAHDKVVGVADNVVVEGPVSLAHLGHVIQKENEHRF